MYLLNLHTTPKGHLIKFGTFLQEKGFLLRKNIRSHDVLNGLNSLEFLEILNSNKTSNIFPTYQLKITFKHLNFVRKPFLMCFNPGSEYFHLFYTVSTQAMYINKKTSYFKPFREVESRFKIVYFFLYTPYIPSIQTQHNINYS